MKSLPYLFFGLLFLVSCTSSGSANHEEIDGPFFDLAGFMDAEIQTLQAGKVPLEKTIRLNGTTETQTILDIDYEQELRLFRNADINKPAWVDKYRETTEAGELGLQTLTYEALDSTLLTQSLAITLQGEEVRSISIHRKTGSVLSQGEQLLLYLPGESYRINASQKARIGGDLTSTIEGKFMP